MLSESAVFEDTHFKTEIADCQKKNIVERWFSKLDFLRIRASANNTVPFNGSGITIGVLNLYIVTVHQFFCILDYCRTPSSLPIPLLT